MIVTEEDDRRQQNETEERKMICYKINIDLDQPIPTVKNDRGRKEYDEETVERINNALSEHNSKYLGRRCAFIYQDTKSRLSLGFALSGGTALADALDELTRMAEISGRTEQEEITVKALERLTHFGFRNTFEFDNDDLEAFGIVL